MMMTVVLEERKLFIAFALGFGSTSSLVVHIDDFEK